MLDNKSHHPKLIDDYIVPENVGGIMVDIGVAIGAFTKEYADKFDMIYGFEPTYTNFVRAIYNTRKLDNVMLYPMGFSDKEMDILTMKSTGQNLYSYTSDVTPEIERFKYDHVKPASEETQTTFTINLESILKLCGGHINYLKMDCEGAEMCLIDNDEVKNIDYIGMEVHEFIYGNPKLNNLKSFLSNYFEIKVNENIWFCQNKSLSL